MEKYEKSSILITVGIYDSELENIRFRINPSKWNENAREYLGAILSGYCLWNLEPEVREALGFDVEKYRSKEDRAEFLEQVTQSKAEECAWVKWDVLNEKYGKVFKRCFKDQDSELSKKLVYNIIEEVKLKGDTIGSLLKLANIDGESVLHATVKYFKK